MLAQDDLEVGRYYYSRKLNNVGRWDGSMFRLRTGAVSYDVFKPKEEATWGTPRIEL